MNRETEVEANHPTSKRIVYIIGTYPDLTKTFIDREILEAKRSGLNVSVVAMRRSNADGLNRPVQRLMEEIVYIVPVQVIPLVKAHAHFLARRFPVYVRSLFHLLTRDHPSMMARYKTFLHFCAGVLAAEYLRRIKMPDHIHAHFADGAAVIAMVISRLLDVPYSLTAHAYDIYRAPVMLLEKVQHAKFVTTCTAFNKHHLEQQTGRIVQLIYHGLDFSTIAQVPVPERKPCPPLILSVGRLTEKKGFAYLIDACARLAERGLDFACEIVGEGPDQAALATRIHELGLDGKVVLTGSLPNADVFLKYAEASLFALPSCVTAEGDRDGIPNVILEAMAFGVPVVSTEISGIPEVIRHEETGLLVQPRDAEGLSQAIARLLEDRQEASKLGQEGSNFVRREFDIRGNVSGLSELFAD